MKHNLVAVGLGLASVAAFSQGVAPLGGNALLISETTRKVSIGWSENSRSDLEPGEMNWSRAADGVEVLTGSRGGVPVDPNTFLHYPVASGVLQMIETVSQSSNREGKALESDTFSAVLLESHV